MTIEQLLARQQELLNAARSDGNRSFSDEEQREFDILQAQIEALRSVQAPEPTNDPTPAQADNTREVENERQRTLEITNLCRDFSIDASQYIQDGTSIDDVRKEILEKQLKTNAPSSRGIEMGKDEREKLRDAAVHGTLLRSGIEVTGTIAPGADELRNLTLKELAKETLRMEGVSNATRLSDEELLRQHLTPTSLFGQIMDLSARTTFEQAYTQAETSYQEWVKTGTLKDFRPTKTFQAGTAGELLYVPENGELKHDDPYGIEGPTRQLLTFGRQFSMSRNAFINDDIGFIQTLPALYAQSARLGINRLVYQTLTANAAIWDGKTLFHADHGNLATKVGSPSVETLSEARSLLRKQKAAGGDVPLNIPARFMLVPTALETKAGQLIGTSVDPAAQNHNVVNPFYNSLKIISDAELDVASETAWYTLSDKLRSPIQVDFLNGRDMPTIVMKEAPAGQLGYIWDVFIDYGVTVVDYKTAIKNEGQ